MAGGDHQKMLIVWVFCTVHASAMSRRPQLCLNDKVLHASTTGTSLSKELLLCLVPTV